MNHNIRLAFALLLLAMSAVPTFFYFGPALEARFFPVLKLDAVEVRTERLTAAEREIPALLFRTHVVKWRACALHTFAFRWLFDHTVEATPVFFVESGEIFQPRSVVDTGEFTSRELYTEIPTVAYNFTQATFMGTAYFTCHPLWPLPYSFRISVPIPKVADG